MNKSNRISFIILGIIVVITILFLVSLLTNLSSVGNDPKMGTWINYNLIWAYVLFFVAAGTAVLFALFQMATDFKSAKGALMGVGAMLAIVVVSYLLASGDLPNFPGVQKFIENGSLTANVSKWVDTGLITCYLLLGIAFLSLLYASVSKLIGR